MPTGSGSQPFMVDLLSKSEYYPYGMKINDLSYNATGARYGYNGTHEQDLEVNADGNYVSFGDFGYDTRVAMRQNIDPMFAAYPHLSGYATFNNNPITYSDPTGYEPNEVVVYADKDKPKANENNDAGTKIVDGLKDLSNFIAGIGNSVSSNLLWQPKNLYNSERIVDDRTRKSYQNGEKVGEVISLYISAIEISAGEGMVAVGGVFALPSGGLSLSVSAVGAGFMVHGSGSAAVASAKLLNNAIVESRSNGNSDHKYIPAPENLKAFPDAKLEKRKTKSGGGLRKRWKDSKGKIYEWDSKKGEVEIYDKTGKNHQGGYDPDTGTKISPAKSDRKVKP